MIRIVACTLTVALVACRGEEGRVLRGVEEVRLGSDSAATLAVDAGGRWWLGRAGEVLVRDSVGVVERIAVPAAAAPRVLGWLGPHAYLDAGDLVVMAEGSPDSARATRSGFGGGPLLVEDRPSAVYHGAASGAVLEYDVGTLEPVSGWGALGQPTTALAGSPQGDRLYQALGPGEEGERLLIRDRQTGRILGEQRLDAPLEALASDERGTLYGVSRSGRRVAVIALRPTGEGVERLWERRLRGRAEEGEVRLVVRAGRIAVGTPPPGPALRLLAPEDGEVIGRAAGRPLDFDLGPRGALWALYPGVLRRLR